MQLGLPSSPEKIIALKNKVLVLYQICFAFAYLFESYLPYNDLLQAVLDIGGNKLNAMAIEHFILRHPSNKEVRIAELTYV